MVLVLNWPGGTGKTQELLSHVRQNDNNYLVVIDWGRKHEIVRDYKVEPETADRILIWATAASFFKDRPQKPNIFIDDIDKILNSIVGEYGQLAGVSHRRPWFS